MKKILIILTILVMSLSAITLSACGKKDEAGNSSEAPKSFEFSTSSSVSRVRGSASSQSVSASADDGNSNTSTSVNTSTSASESSSPLPFISISYSSVPDGANINAKAVMNCINNIGAVEYSPLCEQKIIIAETSYNSLTAAEKSEVINYSSLTAARAAYEKLAKDASLAFVEQFKTAVGNIATFEYSTAYKSKLDEADSIYARIISSLTSSVSSEKSALESKKLLYSDTTFKTEFETVLNRLPAVEAIQAENKADIKTLKLACKNITATQKALFANYADTEAKVNAYVDKLNIVYPEYVYLIQTDGKNGNAFFTLSNVNSSTRDEFVFESQKLTTVVKLGTLSFNAPYAGQLTLLLAFKNEPVTYSITYSGGSNQVVVSSQSQNIHEINIPSAGNVTITANIKDNSGLYGVVFC